MDKDSEIPEPTDTQVLHRLLFAGKCLPGFDEAAMRDAVARYLGRAPTELFSGKPVVVKEGLDAAEVGVTKKELEAIGARVEVDSVQAPPPMQPLGFLDLTVPAPIEQPNPSENLAVVDSGWTAPIANLAPLPDEALPDYVLNNAAAPSPAGTDERPATMHGAPMISRALTEPTPSLRPPTDRSVVLANAPAPVGEPSSVFEPIPRSPLPPARDTGPSAIPEAAAPLAAPAAAANEFAVICPNCSEGQPMRVLCRACGTNLKSALAAQHEEREQKRASRAGLATTDKAARPVNESKRFLGLLVPDHVADRFTWVAGLRALFVFLSVLVVLSLVWSKFRSDPIRINPEPTPEVSAPGPSVEASASTADIESHTTAGAPPLEEDLVSRLQGGAAAAMFRQSYWPKQGNKAFVVSGNATWTWRAEMPSVTRALAEALDECESYRLPDAPACKVVSVNNFWQD